MIELFLYLVMMGDDVLFMTRDAEKADFETQAHRQAILERMARHPDLSDATALEDIRRRASIRTVKVGVGVEKYAA